MKILQNILIDLEIILLNNINNFNKLTLKYEEYNNNQDFTNLTLLEPGNEYLLEQWSFNNRKANENKCKRLRPYEIHIDNIALQEYKIQIEGSDINKNVESITQTLHNLLHELETSLNKSFKLTSKITQDTLFTESILIYLSDLDDIKDKEIINALEYLLSNGGNDVIKLLLFNQPKIKTFYKDIILNFNKYINEVIIRLDKIPVIEQKTDAWFKLRADMISASICGYIDGYVSGAGISKEHEKIKEKAGITSKKSFSMGTGPLKHGILFEDVTSDIYDTLNGVISKEYGILPDYRYSEIGASPDGVVIDFKNRENEIETTYMEEDIFRLCKYGRMREIKNPTSRSIENGKMPNYYYYQMQQQMYVCDLPYCDFIQTSIKYPDSDMTLDENRIRNFFNDTFDINNLNKINSFKDLYNYFPRYLIEKINWWYGMQKSKLYDKLVITNILNIELLIIKDLCNNWNLYCNIPLTNLSKSGKIKGIFWYYTKGNGDNLEYKYYWTPLYNEITYESISNITRDYLTHWVDNGYALSDKYYFTVDLYNEKEIEYNQSFYENVLSRLLNKWKYILYLRSIKDDNLKLDKFNETYILHNKKNKTFNDMKSYNNDLLSNSNKLSKEPKTIEELLGITKNISKIKKKKKNIKSITPIKNIDIVNAIYNDDDDIFNLD